MVIFYYYSYIEEDIKKGLFFIFTVPAGIFVAIPYFLPWSMLPDIIEYDTYRSGKIRESAFYSIFVFFQKIGFGISLLFTAHALDDIRDDIKIDQKQELHLKIVMSTVSSVGLLIGNVFLYFYTVTKTITTP